MFKLIHQSEQWKLKHYWYLYYTGQYYKTASTQSGQFLVTEKSARHSTRPHYFYCPFPDFTSRCADCRADTRGHFNCLSVGNKQSLCPLMWGAQQKSGGIKTPSAGASRRHCAPPPLANGFRHHCTALRRPKLHISNTHNFDRPDVLPVAKPTAWKHLRQILTFAQSLFSFFLTKILKAAESYRIRCICVGQSPSSYEIWE